MRKQFKFNKRWFAQQTWRNILFVHFPVPLEIIKKYIPDPFTIDTFDGQAWIGIVSFEALNSRLRGMPTFCSYRYFLQLNVRTYIKFAGEKGIFFFSIDANRKLPVIGAKFVSLPYFYSEMQFHHDKQKFQFNSNRSIINDPQHLMFHINYEPTSDPFVNEKDSLLFWLTERYRLFFIRGKKIYRAPLSHEQWKLQVAKFAVRFNHNDKMPFLDYCLPSSSIAHYAHQMDAYLHPFTQEGIYLK